MKKSLKNVFLISILAGVSSCDYIDEIEAKAAKVNRYEIVSLKLAKENRDLENEIGSLNYQIAQLKAKNDYLKIKLSKLENPERAERTIASIPPVDPVNDLVKFDVYKWKPGQVLAVAEKEFNRKNFEKSAQFFNSFTHHFPEHKAIDDYFLFQAGIASYESGKHDHWTLTHLNKLIEEYPASKYYRGAKLWVALTNLKLGNKDKFFDTVEEFRKKYRNTSEWKILSGHYETIVQKYKR